MTSPRPTAYRRPPVPPDALRLDANEGAAPGIAPTAWPLAAETLRRYPDASSLEAELAARHGVPATRVLVTAGGDDGIDRLCRRNLRGGRELVLTEPTFEMFHRYAELAGARVRGVPWWEGPYPVDDVARQVGPATGLVVAVSPNNPTGATLTAAELARLRAATGDRVLLLDAAYTEFADEDLTPTALALPRTVVLRTLSKAWGLAGLRVGYLLGPADLLAELRAWGPPYAVAGTSLALAGAALAGGDAEVAARVAAVRRERGELTARLRRAGAAPLASQGNFVLCRPRQADLLTDGLAALGVVVRGWPGHALLDGCVRITCPADPAEAARLRRDLDTVLAPEALLLDMDGVIADEGPSYRETMVAVAAELGCPLSRRDIARAKAAGGANDDWDLTRRLLAARGVDLPQAEVTRRFQRLYLGDERRTGLCARETLIPPRELLTALAGRLPLAIVTGRPRADAVRFLARFDLADLFQAVITRDDAPAKPDPAPVREALRRLGVRRAWLVGDTPDDVRAARAAGVLPLGIRPPDPDDDAGDALRTAGAATVLTDLAQLKELLP